MLSALGQAASYVKLNGKFNKFRSHTMVPRRQFVENLMLAKKALSNPALDGGAVIECGTWKGGMSAALVEIGGPWRPYYFFDSFDGLPPAEPIDGEDAAVYQARPESPEYFNNCKASVDDFKEALALAKFPPWKTNIIEGFFDKTFPEFRCRPIAVLRLDADWYSSTTLCLEKFFDHVLPGGLILIDDYYRWDGCARAVHEFLKSAGVNRIEQGRIGGTAHIWKR
jgi:O-methyltransferase